MCKQKAGVAGKYAQRADQRSANKRVRAATALLEEGASSDEEDEQEEELQYLRKVSSTSRKHSQSTPLTVPAALLGKELLMEVDTGASVSVMAEETYRSLRDAQSRPHLRETSRKLQT